MKKKITTLVLITMTTMTMLTACGNTKDTNTPTPTIEASSEVAESKEESESVEVSSEPTSESKVEESTFVYSERRMAVFPKLNGQTYCFVRAEDDKTRDGITFFSTDETSNCTNAFYWMGPETMGSGAKVFGDHTTLFNNGNTSVIKYYWNATPSEATLGESDDTDYDLMISNGQFKFHFPSDYDQEKAWEVFNSFKVLTIDEANAMVEDFESKSQALNGQTLVEQKAFLESIQSQH